MNARQILHLEVAKQARSVRVDFNVRNINNRLFGNVVILAFTLLLLKLERNALDGSLGNTPHKVGGVAGNLVPKTLGRDNCDFLHSTLVSVEVLGQAGVVFLNDELGSPLDGSGADATLSFSKTPKRI